MQHIYGILNVTPDSFSDGSPQASHVARAVRKALALYKDGADVVDIGGESTRPGFAPISIEEECDRVLPVIKGIKKRMPHALISIDTRKAEVAERALDAGASIVNAYGGLEDPAMLALVEERRCTVIAYHVADIRQLSEEEAVQSVLDFFLRQFALVQDRLASGLLICDPGIGFGKTFNQNIAILRHVIMTLASAHVPVMVGVSRKQHLGLILKRKLNLAETPGPSERIEAGLAEVAYALDRGATHVRTHDVLATKRFLAVWSYLNQTRGA